MDNKTSFLGIGWGFPPAFDEDSLTVQMVQAEEDINQSLQILLSTRLGERVMQPTYGCSLADYQFEALSASLIGFLRDLVERAILFHEPRVRLDKVSITDPDSADLFEGRLLITVEYTVVETNSRFNFVYPFYLQEGAQILR